MTATSSVRGCAPSSWRRRAPRFGTTAAGRSRLPGSRGSCPARSGRSSPSISSPRAPRP